MYSKHVPACKLLLQRLTRHPTYIDDLLLTCNNEVVRSTLASLIGVVLCTVTPLEDGFLTERESTMQDEAGGAGTGAGRVGPEPVVGEPRAVAARFIDMYVPAHCVCVCWWIPCASLQSRRFLCGRRFVGRLGEARKNWTRFSDYFSVLLAFAKISHKCRAFVSEPCGPRCVRVRSSPPWCLGQCHTADCAWTDHDFARLLLGRCIARSCRGCSQGRPIGEQGDATQVWKPPRYGCDVGTQH